MALKKTARRRSGSKVKAAAVKRAVRPAADGVMAGQTLSSVFARAREQAIPSLKNPNVERQISALIKKMTLKEKAGQLAQYAAGIATGPGTGRDDYAQMIQRGEVGSLLNVMDAKKANAFQRMAVEESRLGIPLLFGYDIIHGNHTTFPIPLGMASSFDPEMVQAAMRQAAVEARRDGINWVFSPMVDIARDARWGRVVEGSGEEVVLGVAMAAAAVRGYQQDDLSKPDSVAACVKHIAGYGAPMAGREYNTVEMSDVTFEQVYLPPYEATVAAGVATGMCAFHTLRGVPCTGNQALLTGTLRGRWGFEGMIVSDWGSVGEMQAHGVANDPETTVVKGLVAGTDMDMESNVYGRLIPTLVKSGRLPIKVVDEAVRRVLRVKFALGLFEKPYVDETQSSAPTAESRALARSVAEKSMVLVKNAPGIDGQPLLPLKSVARVALIGPMADDGDGFNGTWAGGANHLNTITLRKALEERLSLQGATLTYEQGCDAVATSQDGIAAAMAAAAQADVVILALGEKSGQSGEAGARTRLDLSGAQQALLEAVVAAGKPVVLVLVNGHPLTITWAAEHVPAILVAWAPGIEAGPAICNILFGEANPCGKLPVTFPRTVGQCPIFLGQMNTGRPVIHTDLSHPPTNNGERYISRYIDEINAPLYPFGWGLSYTRFTYAPVTADKAKLSVRELMQGKRITLRVTVTNAGERAGAEVVQLYMNNRGTSVAQPVRRLVGFQRAELAAGESRVVKFVLGVEDLAFVNLALKKVVEPSVFVFFAGGDSGAENQVVVTVA